MLDGLPVSMFAQNMWKRNPSTPVHNFRTEGNDINRLKFVMYEYHEYWHWEGEEKGEDIYYTKLIQKWRKCPGILVWNCEKG